MRIGHCQLESKCGDFEGNLAKLVKGLEQAQRDRVEVVCFPRMLPDRLPRHRGVGPQAGFRP